MKLDDSAFGHDFRLGFFGARLATTVVITAGNSVGSSTGPWVTCRQLWSGAGCGNN